MKYMALFTKLEFTEEQKKEYKKLKMVVLIVGIIGLLLTCVFYMSGDRANADIAITITLAILIVYAYRKYRNILSKSGRTVEYSKFQKEIYSKAFKYFIVPGSIGSLILMYFCFKYYISPWWLIIFVIIYSIVVGIWTSWYEKKKFGSIKRAP